jgi:hypothetical protein
MLLEPPREEKLLVPALHLAGRNAGIARCGGFVDEVPN